MREEKIIIPEKNYYFSPTSEKKTQRPNYNLLTLKIFYAKSLIEKSRHDKTEFLLPAEWIGTYLGVSQPQVAKIIGTLLQDGLIEKTGEQKLKGSKFRSNVYTVNDKMIEAYLYTYYKQNLPSVQQCYSLNGALYLANHPEEDQNYVLLDSAKLKRMQQKHQKGIQILSQCENWFDHKYLLEGRYRKVNSLCSLPNPEKSGNPIRLDTIKAAWGVRDIVNYDRNASSTSIAYGLGHDGKGYEGDEDIYKIIFEGTNLPLHNLKWSDFRDDFKALIQPMIMSNRDTWNCQSYRWYREGSLWEEPTSYQIKRFQQFEQIEKATGEKLEKILPAIRESWLTFTNLKKSPGSELMTIESDLMTLMNLRAAQAGIKMDNVYDESYCEPSLSKEAWDGLWLDCLKEVTSWQLA